MNQAARKVIQFWEAPKVDTFRRVKKIEIGNGEEALLPVNFRFQLIPDLDTDSDVPSCLSTLIRKAGGKPCNYDDDDYALPIIDLWGLGTTPHQEFAVPHDTYSSWFIYHSIRNHKNNLPPPDPKQYLITPSIYGSYEPRELLMRNIKWSELDALEERKFYSSKTIMDKLKPNIPSSVVQPQVGRQTLSDEEASVVSNGTEDTENEGPAAFSAHVCLNNNPSNEDDEAAPRNVEVSESSESKIQSSATPKTKKTNLKRKNGDASEDASKESSNVSKDKVCLAPSPDNHNPVALKRPRLVPKAVAGPSKKNSEQKKSKGKQSVSTKDDHWVDCGTQESAIEDVSFDNNNHSDVSDISYHSDVVSVSSGSSKQRRRAGRRKNGKPYSVEEDKLIVQMILDQNAILFTKGRKMWQLLAKSVEFKGKRTWESLSNRWKMQIVPRILANNKAYSISTDKLERIKQMQKIPHGHDKRCPDIVF